MLARMVKSSKPGNPIRQEKAKGMIVGANLMVITTKNPNEIHDKVILANPRTGERMEVIL